MMTTWLTTQRKTTGPPKQNRRVIFGCCGQAFSTEYVDGHCAPKCTYGLQVFDKIKDKEERDLMNAMIADALDHMQESEDYIETVELKNPLPFNDLPWNHPE
jgi:hypothetical protein